MKHWISLLTLLGLIGIGLILQENPPQQISGPTQDSNEHTLTAFANHFELEQFNQTGQLASRIKAKRSDYWQKNPKRQTPADYALLYEPEMIFYRDSELPWFAKAQKGISRNNGAQVELTGNVLIWQFDAQGLKTELSTEKLLLKPEQQYAETDLPLTVNSPQGTTDATGMTANMATNTVKLLKDVRSRYEIRR